jgi:hypothetical protein
VKNGYSAYSKYRNAENLDRLKDEAAARANSLTSLASGPVLPTGRTDTTFRRLDPAFLNSGEAAKVAAEFERETGLKRGEFLNQLASVSEQKIKRSDPQMIDKAFSRLENFLQKIPNKDFRKNAEKAISLVPDTMRRGIVAQAVQKLAGSFADASSATPSGIEGQLSDIALANKAGQTPATGSGNAGTAVDAGKSDAKEASGRDPAAVGADAKSTTGSTITGTGNGPRGAGKTGIDGVVSAALLESRDQARTEGSLGGTDGESTIFQQVTKRYRLLTPLLTKPAN